jgi:hypothetical protein
MEEIKVKKRNQSRPEKSKFKFKLSTELSRQLSTIRMVNPEKKKGKSYRVY